MHGAVPEAEIIAKCAAHVRGVCECSKINISIVISACGPRHFSLFSYNSLYALVLLLHVFMVG